MIDVPRSSGGRFSYLAAAHGVGSSGSALVAVLWEFAGLAGMLVTNAVTVSPTVVAVVSVALRIRMKSIKTSTKLLNGVVGLLEFVD